MAGKLIMTKGLPASGKSTWAKEMQAKDPTIVIVTKDDIREELAYKEWNHNVEKDVVKRRDFLISQALNVGRTVISADTNLAPKHEKVLRDMARKYRAQFEVKDFTDVPLDTCIQRDYERIDGKVGERVIQDMYNRYLAPVVAKVPHPEVEMVLSQPVVPQPVVPNIKLPPAVVCDLDGTLALHNGRSPYDFKRCDTDLVNEPIRAIINLFCHSGGHKILYVSGRDDVVYDKTRAWLDDHNCPKGNLYMRTSGDKRNDAIVKQELFDDYIRDKWDVRFVLDDRDRVVAMWRTMGLTCLQVDYGAF